MKMKRRLWIFIAYGGRETMHVGLEQRRNRKWNFSLYRKCISWGGSVYTHSLIINQINLNVDLLWNTPIPLAS